MLNIKKIFNYLLSLDFYTSPLDVFLAKFRTEHPDLSLSQREEAQKYSRIYKQRDQATTPVAQQDKIWNKF